MARKKDTLSYAEILDELTPSLETLTNGEFKLKLADLQSLIGHSESVDADQSLEEVHKKMYSQKREFVAVREEGQLIGICSRSEIGTVLGRRYGYSLFSNRPIKNYLLKDYLTVTTAHDIVDVFFAANNRSQEYFYDDLVLIDESGKYLGMIYMRTLVVIQNWFFLNSIKQLKQQKELLNRQNQKVEQNMLLAGQLQQAMFQHQYPSFPSHVPSEQSMLKFHHFYESPEILGGDFFHIVHLSDHRAGVFMCDVLGHDVSAALVASMIRALLGSYRSAADNPGELLTKINNKFLEMLSDYPETIFATACYLVVDVGLKQYELAVAGHPIPIRLIGKSCECNQLDVAWEFLDPPLGILENLTYQTSIGSINKGDLFISYTDGLFEVFNEHQEEFGMDRLMETITKYCRKKTANLFDSVISEIKKHSKSRHFTDDVCLVGVEVDRVVSSKSMTTG